MHGHFGPTSARSALGTRVKNIPRGGGHVKDARESRAFSALSKEHMSTDEDNTDADGEGGWVSRPPTYRSNNLSPFTFCFISVLKDNLQNVTDVIYSVRKRHA